MRSADVIIVGGGPAGSSCAWRLRQQGVDCLILDRERFPRHKLCAGWITPGVVEDLELDIGAYPHRFLSFNKLLFHFPLLGMRPLTMQHSIRRYEFDAWLLERSGAPLETHTVRTVCKEGSEYVIDQRYRCRYLVSMSFNPCHFSGKGLSDFERRIKSSTSMVSSSVFVRNNLPLSPMISPISNFLRSRNFSPSMFFRKYT